MFHSKEINQLSYAQFTREEGFVNNKIYWSTWSSSACSRSAYLSVSHEQQQQFQTGDSLPLCTWRYIAAAWLAFYRCTDRWITHEPEEQLDLYSVSPFQQNTNHAHIESIMSQNRKKQQTEEGPILFYLDYDLYLGYSGSERSEILTLLYVFLSY